MAVGSWYTPGSNARARPLAERWNGRKWMVESFPSPTISSEAYVLSTGIDCANATRCIAVGRYQIGTSHSWAFAEAWNGRRWSTTGTVNPIFNPFNSFYGVSCPQPDFCIAVGDSGARTLVERWNGVSWHVLSSANPPYPKSSQESPQLDSVSCVSPSDCVASGSTYHYGFDSTSFRQWGGMAALAEQWNGATWSIMPSPNHEVGANRDNTLPAVACTGATKCVAVGSFARTSGIGLPIGAVAGTTLTEELNGSTWKIVPSPPTWRYSDFYGLSCVQAHCVAVGGQARTRRPLTPHGSPLAERWNGTSWSIMHAVDQPGVISLRAISCAQASDCMAVGSNQKTAISELWSGGTNWRFVPIAKP